MMSVMVQGQKVYVCVCVYACVERERKPTVNVARCLQLVNPVESAKTFVVPFCPLLFGSEIF